MEDGAGREKAIRTHQDLDVYRMAFEAAMVIFELSRGFPVEERYSPTDQICRSSRSVAANLAEAWRRRRYSAAFVQSLNRCEAEAAETQVWLEGWSLLSGADISTAKKGVDSIATMTGSSASSST